MRNSDTVCSVSGKRQNLCLAGFCPHSAGVLPARAVWQNGKPYHTRLKPYVVRPSGPNLGTYSTHNPTIKPSNSHSWSSCWAGLDMQAELLFGSVPDACVAEVPGRLLVPIQLVDGGGLATFSCVSGSPVQIRVR